ncbi:MAG: Gfo/Idh/MocA family oxidoreductase [Roseiflexus sp.]|jgi:predicted dehydrogenase|nr:Gfo/Idh/MocA family oxidoreductase [Roseiflexus sp.]MBO9334586.1 Gfo/Idh/MocA family oxidoreductase [Roseiflexus sp.]MBO9341557.1 Gfo/Idh/MocA family oxidoreductase [Roseiflexus sp.]MBO9364972.1 Gfo/Idh/MocA family oxidoreductase [Roseiflexus sp.]MBO9382647.1 Gfo/Idh/MocA family oxidoreductase [Roseiflexus sp.]
MADILRAALIGAGIMGLNHARVYSEMDDVELVAIADVDPNAVARSVQRFRVRGYTDYREMLEREQLDLVSVATPTEHHFAVARDTLRAGIATLVEKPIAATVQQGAELITLAHEMGVLLTVGHIERFNPAIIALKGQLEHGALGRVYQITSRRIGPFPSRIKDVGVVIDLATHDLDVMHYLTDSIVIKLHAEIGRRLHTAHEDLLSAVLRFENDIIGMLDINWLSPNKVRELSVIGERGMFVANYITQDLTLYENDLAPYGAEWPQAALMGVTEGRMIRFKVNKKEPLRAELDAFAAAVRSGGPPPVRPEDALLALMVARKLIESGAYGETLYAVDKHGKIWKPLQPRRRYLAEMEAGAVA